MGNADSLPVKFIGAAAVLEKEVVRVAYRTAYKIARDTLRQYFPEEHATQLAATIARQLKDELTE